jgi:xanthosine utilization system XapX-like protein
MAALAFLSERTGKLSASRLLLLLWGVGVLVVWVINSLLTRQLQAIPESVVTILGILVGGKTVQRFGEK